MRELQAGVWHWSTEHPGWTPSEPWGPEVSSYAIDDGERMLLFDPLAVPDDLIALAEEREPVIVLTSPWHERTRRRSSSDSTSRCSRPRPTRRRA